MSVNVLYKTSAKATGGRDGEAATLDGALSVKLATPKELGGGGGAGNNPEQLFAAGYAACFLGAVVSSVSMASIAGLNGSSRGDDLSGIFRAGGTGSAKACRTVSLPIWYRFASPRIDTPSTRASLRILANSSMRTLIRTSQCNTAGVPINPIPLRRSGKSPGSVRVIPELQGIR